MTLFYNLLEISKAKAPLEELVLSEDGQALVHKKTLLGKIYHRSPDEKLIEVREEFWKKIHDVNGEVDTFYLEWKARVQRKPFNERGLAESKEKILDFCQEFKGLIKILLKSDSHPLKNFLFEDRAFSKEIRKTFEDIRFCHKITDFQSYTQQEIPFRAFYRIAEGDLPEKKFERWVEVAKKISPSKVFTLLRRACAYFSNNTVHFSRVYLACVERGLFQVVEERKKKFKSGDSLVFNDSKLVLGNMLLPNTYEVIGNPSYVLETCESLLTLTQALIPNHSEMWMVSQPKVHDISMKGDFLFKEKIVSYLKDRTWDVVTKLRQEKRVYDFLVAFLKQLIQLPMTPFPLDPDQFGFTADGELRTLVSVEFRERSYERLVEFAYQAVHSTASPGTYERWIEFYFLMRDSGLSACSESENYKSLYLNAVNGMEREVAVSNNGSEKNPYVLLHRGMIYDRVIKAKEYAFMKLRKTRYQFNDEEIKQEVLNALKLEYGEAFIGCRFDKNFEITIKCHAGTNL